MTIETKARAAGGRNISGRPAAWLKLAAGIGIILLFMFWIGPALQKLPGFAAMGRFIDESGIRAGAIYYTDVKEVGDAVDGLRDRLQFRLEQLPRDKTAAK